MKLPQRLPGVALLARWVFLIYEAELDSHKDGIDSFIDRYGACGLAELASAYEKIGATELAAISRRIAGAIPHPSEVDLNHMNELVGARTGYDCQSIRALVEDELNVRRNEKT